MKNLWLESKNVPDYLKDEIRAMDSEQLTRRFQTNLEFGTGGLRGILGAGTDRMNVMTIRQATLGFAKYLKANYDGEIKVAIGYDSRHYSVEFSEQAAVVLASLGIKTLIYDQVKPTPLLSFAVREFGCQGGIMITASHNPKEYNGYKVYNDTGAQANLEQSQQIIDEINNIEDITSIDFDSFQTVLDNEMVAYIDESFDDVYLKALEGIEKTNEQKKDVKIVFSPAHGTSGVIGPKVLNHFGYNNIIEVKEQMIPDGDFTHMTSANPEDLAAYDLALEYAKANDGDVIVVNDPDADRLGVMFKNRGGEYIAYSGNQIGTLLIDYIRNNTDLDSSYSMYNTIVTGQMGTEIIKEAGVNFKQTLVGFKFIGEQIANNPDKNFVFGYEESYGYLLSDIVRDKDAMQSLLIVAEMVNYYLNRDLYLDEVMEELYQKYGYYIDVTKSIAYSGDEGLDKIKRIMKHFTETEVTAFAGHKVLTKIDYASGIDDLPKANVIKFELEELGWVVFRPSGTEPKIKTYLSIKGASFADSEATLEAIYQEIVTCFDSL
ncbi:phospho-sugar mutase [Mollicutes bacterium LVI A0039]|nr:phospho-sugar mutase [Mollicutes bacterium LVI A0039]